MPSVIRSQLALLIGSRKESRSSQPAQGSRTTAEYSSRRRLMTDSLGDLALERPDGRAGGGEAAGIAALVGDQLPAQAAQVVEDSQPLRRLRGVLLRGQVHLGGQ